MWTSMSDERGEGGNYPQESDAGYPTAEGGVNDSPKRINAAAVGKESGKLSIREKSQIN